MFWIDAQTPPPETARYLCWEKFYSPSIGNVPVIGIYDAKNKVWETEIAEDYSKVTHWMKLPPPPEETWR
jgi:hypothetical protein